MLVVCAMASAIRAGVKGDVIRLKNAETLPPGDYINKYWGGGLNTTFSN